MDPYKILGIDPSAQKIDIKKAFAKLLKENPPEKDAEKYQQIREAYEQAIKNLSHQNSSNSTNESSESKESKETQESAPENNEAFSNNEVAWPKDNFTETQDSQNVQNTQNVEGTQESQETQETQAEQTEQEKDDIYLNQIERDLFHKSVANNNSSEKENKIKNFLDSQKTFEVKDILDNICLREKVYSKEEKQKNKNRTKQTGSNSSSSDVNVWRIIRIILYIVLAILKLSTL